RLGPPLQRERSVSTPNRFAAGAVKAHKDRFSRVAASAALLCAVAFDCEAQSAAKLFDQWTYQPIQRTGLQSGTQYANFIPVGYAESQEYFRAALVSNSKRGYVRALQTRCFKLDRISPAFGWIEKYD